MDLDENRNIWQCTKLFHHTCPRYKHHAMKEIIPLLQGEYREVSMDSIQAAEQLCEHCPDFYQDMNVI